MEQRSRRIPKPTPAAAAAGCLFAGFWVAMLVFTVLLFTAAWLTAVHDEPSESLKELAWWLFAAGCAATAILVSSMIIFVRLKRGLRAFLDDAEDDVAQESTQQGGSSP